MKRIFITSVAALLCVCSFASEPAFRSIGYKGNASLTDQLGVFIGLDTSHGYMIGSQHYVGVGAGAFIFPNGTDYPMFLNAFADYQFYMRKYASSSPFIGVRAGFSHAFKYEEKSGINFKNAVLAEPSFGWSWGLKSGQGLAVSIGLPMYIPVWINMPRWERRTDKPVLPMPKISFTFEF